MHKNAPLLIVRLAHYHNLYYYGNPNFWWAVWRAFHLAEVGATMGIESLNIHYNAPAAPQGQLYKKILHISDIIEYQWYYRISVIL